MLLLSCDFQVPRPRARLFFEFAGGSCWWQCCESCWWQLLVAVLWKLLVVVLWKCWWQCLVTVILLAFADVQIKFLKW